MIVIRIYLLFCIPLIVVAAGCAGFRSAHVSYPPAPGGGLAGLPEFRDFTAARESSFDPTGGNADGRMDWPFAPGETRVIADIPGAGVVTHLWFTVATQDKQHLRNMVLRMYWDGEESPSVECPLGDFFGLGHARYYQYSSLPIQIGTDKGMNCYWRMPFSNGARVTVTNDGPLASTAFYYYVDYERHASIPKDVGRFHAQYRQAFPCEPGGNYTFMEATGRGHFVGVNLSIHNRTSGWWGEGDDMFYIDGEEAPSLQGTGSEDYFGGAWAYGDPKVLTFDGAYLGMPFNEGDHAQNGLWNVYRYHVEDPIPFKKSIRATMEHGHANNRNDDFASVAYWYQTEPHAPFPPLPKADERMWKEATVYTEPWAIEAETLAPHFKYDRASAQSTEEFGNHWSQGKQLLLNPAGPDVFRAVLPLSPTDAANYLWDLWYTAGPDYGICEIWLNGEKKAEWDGFNPDGVVRKKLADRPAITIKKTENILEIRVTGKHADSKGFKVGIDCRRATLR